MFLTNFHGLVTLTSFASAFQQGSKRQDISSPAAVQVPELEVNNDIVLNSLSDSCKEITELIKNAESLPSCPKIATSALMHSCSALEGSGQREGSDVIRGSDLFIDEESSIYAARLAVCELSGADFVIPVECQPFIPTERATKKRGIRGYWSKRGPTEPSSAFQYYDEITQTNLQQCRKALGSTAQSWTSYSNNRQNAVVLCRAMRSQVEKDEQLHVARILAQAATATTDSLQDALKQAEEIKKQFSEVSVAMPKFHQDLVSSNQAHLAKVQEFWAQVDRIHDGLNDIADAVGAVGKEIRNAKDEVIDLRAMIHEAADESAVELKAVGDISTKEIRRLSEGVSNLGQTTAYALEMFKQDVAQVLWIATQNITIVNALLPVMTERLMLRAEAEERVHNQTMMNQQELQDSLDQTMIAVLHIGDAVQKANETFNSISVLMNVGWPSALELVKTAGTFAGYSVLYSLLSFGLWESFIGFAFLGTVCATAATSLGFAFISTFVFSPVQFCRSMFASTAAIILDYQLLLGLTLGILITVTIAAARSTLTAYYASRGRNHGSPYDPTKAPYV